jgi:hypothetical protein
MGGEIAEFVFAFKRGLEEAGQLRNEGGEISEKTME